MIQLLNALFFALNLFWSNYMDYAGLECSFYETKLLGICMLSIIWSSKTVILRAKQCLSHLSFSSCLHLFASLNTQGHGHFSWIITEPWQSNNHSCFWELPLDRSVKSFDCKGCQCQTKYLQTVCPKDNLDVFLKERCWTQVGKWLRLLCSIFKTKRASGAYTLPAFNKMYWHNS